MKKIALILSLLLMFSLVACAGGGDESSTSSTFSSTSGSTTSSEASSEASDDSSAVSDDSSDVSDESDVSGDESDVSGDESDVSGGEGEDEAVDYGSLFLNKATTTPVVDGNIGENEYTTVIKYDASKSYWSASSTEGAEAYNATLYITWDEEYLYTAVAIGVGAPRTYGNTDYLQNRPYIFDRRHVMSAVILGDPEEDRYKPNATQADPDDPTDWDWGAAANSKLGTEWTTTAQPDGSNISADHFGKLTEADGYEFIVAVSKLETEVYEQRIPWSALNDAASFTPQAGANIGYAFSACCEEVDIEAEDDDAPYACFGAGIIDGKSFARYVGFILKD